MLNEGGITSLPIIQSGYVFKKSFIPLAWEILFEVEKQALSWLKVLSTGDEITG